MRILTGVHRDFSHGLRRVIRQRGTSVIAVLTLALGTGAVVGAQSVIAPVLFRDLPYPDAGSLALVWRTNDASDSRRLSVSPPDFVDLHERLSSFSSLAAMNSFTSTLQDEEGETTQIELGVVSGDFFRVMGVPAALGVTLEPDDDRPVARDSDAGPAPLVLAHDTWVDRFGADSTIVGRSLPVGGDVMTVVGVMPASFRLYLPAGAGMSADLAGWTPLRIDYATGPRDGAFLKVIGRLGADTPENVAAAEVTAVAASLREEFAIHADEGTAFRLAPLRSEVIEHVRWPLIILAIAGGLVLLVACANVAGLLLVRYLARRGELGTRVAMGATRAALMRQLVSEAVILATAGAVLGVVLAWIAVPAILRLEPGLLPRVGDAGPGGAALVLIPVVVVLATLLGGAVPALLATRSAAEAVVRGPRPAGRGTTAIRRVVVMAQIAVGFVLLYGGASLGSTALRLHRQDLGFTPDNALTFRISLPFGNYRGEEVWTSVHQRLRERLAQLPGVLAVGATSDLPLLGSNSLDPFALDPAVEEQPWGTRHALYRVITPDYLDAAGIPLLAGRALEESDRAGAPLVALVDQALARRIEATQPGPVVGRRLDVTLHRFRDGYRVERAAARIVGVVANVAHEHPRAEPGGAIYLAHGQQAFWSMSYILRGTGGATPPLAPARRVVAELDPGIPVHRPRPLTDLVGDSLATDRFLLALVAMFALVVVALALVGLYALMAELGRQRRREFGIRLALGAPPAVVARGVLLSGLALAAGGMLAGLTLLPGLERILARALPFHTGIAAEGLAATVLFLLLASLACCALPAGRAAASDPVSALRE